MIPNAVSQKELGVAGVASPATSSAWRPILWRVAIGIVAIVGLSAIGAVSMLAGLDGAHASPPPSSSSWTPALSSSGSTASPPPQVPTPIALGEAPSAQPAAETAPCPTRTDDGRVILNLATAEDLRHIPGIGPKRAEAILALRAKLKRFKRGADLLRIRGIGAKSLARMQAHFVVDAPAGSDCSVAGAVSAR